MLQSEFDRLTSRPYTEAEFSEIHYIYCYHPAVRSKTDVWKKQSTSGTPPERHTSTPEMRMTSCCGS